MKTGVNSKFLQQSAEKFLAVVKSFSEPTVILQISSHLLVDLF